MGSFSIPTAFALNLQLELEAEAEAEGEGDGVGVAIGIGMLYAMICRGEEGCVGCLLPAPSWLQPFLSSLALWQAQLALIPKQKQRIVVVRVFYLCWHNTHSHTHTETEAVRSRERERKILKVPRRTSIGKIRKETSTKRNRHSHYHYQSVYFGIAAAASQARSLWIARCVNCTWRCFPWKVILFGSARYCTAHHAPRTAPAITIYIACLDVCVMALRPLWAHG